MYVVGNLLVAVLAQLRHALLQIIDRVVGLQLERATSFAMPTP
jgi:hypothetical protein